MTKISFFIFLRHPQTRSYLLFLFTGRNTIIIFSFTIVTKSQNRSQQWCKNNDANFLKLNLDQIYCCQKLNAFHKWAYLNLLLLDWFDGSCLMVPDRLASSHSFCNEYKMNMLTLRYSKHSSELVIMISFVIFLIFVSGNYSVCSFSGREFYN